MGPLAAAMAVAATALGAEGGPPLRPREPVGYAPIVYAEPGKGAFVFPENLLGGMGTEAPRENVRFHVYGYFLKGRPEAFQDLGADLTKEYSIVPLKALEATLGRLGAGRESLLTAPKLAFGEKGDGSMAAITNHNFIRDVLSKPGHPQDGAPEIGNAIEGTYLRLKVARDQGCIVYSEVNAGTAALVKMCECFSWDWAKGEPPVKFEFGVQEPIVLWHARRIEAPAGIRVRPAEALVVPFQAQLQVGRSPLRKRLSEAGRATTRDGAKEFLEKLDPRGYPLDGIQLLILRGELGETDF